MAFSEPATTEPAQETASFYVVGGTLATDAPSYVTREADHQLREALWRGDFCYVLDTRQVGKSSLMVRTALFLKQQGVQVAILDLTRLGQTLNPEQWYYGLLLNLGAQIGRREELRAFWQQNKELGPLQRCMEALRQVALHEEGEIGIQRLTRIDTDFATPEHQIPHTEHRFPPSLRLAIFIDEIDNVLNLPFATDEFFAALRECYTRRAHDPEMRGITFCLLGSTTPDSLIRDVRTTPFNIGTRIEPTDFTLAEAAPLAAGLDAAGRNGALLLQRTLYWTEGHPYLTQRLCHAIAEDGAIRTEADVDRLCAQLFFTKAAREGESNLTFVSNRVLKSGVDLASLLDLLGQVLANKPVKNDPADPYCAILRLSGMVRVVDGTLRIRNRIYRHVFDREWIRANMPDAEWRRQRAAYRRGQVRAAGLFGLIAAALALSLLTLYAIQRAAVSRAHEREADAANAKLKMALEKVRVTLLEAERERKKADNAARKAANAARQSLEARKEADKQRIAAQFQSNKATAASRLAEQNLALAKRNEKLALGSAKEATLARGKLTALLKKNERFVYPTRIQEAERALLLGDMVTASDHLRQCIPSSYQADLRGFEWRFLTEQCRDLSFQTIQAHPAGVAAVAYCPGASLIATIGRGGMSPQDGNLTRDGRLSLWDAATGRLVASIHSTSFRANKAAFSADGQRLAVSEGDGMLHIIDVTTLTLDRTIQVDTGFRAIVAAFSPDGATLATGDSFGIVQLWNATTGQRLQTLDRQWGAVNDLAFSPNGKLLAVALRGQGDAVAKLFDAHTGRETAALGKRPEIGGINLAANCLTFSTDSQLIAIGCSNRMIYVWQTADGAPRCRLNANQNEVTSLAFSPDDSLLVTGSNDRLIKIWDATALHGARPTLYQIATLGGHGGTIRSLTFSPDGRTLASASQDGNVKQWNVQSIVAARYKSGVDTVRAVVFSPEGHLLARVGSGHLDNRQAFVSEPTVRIYDAATLQRYLTLRNDDGRGFICAAFSKDGQRIATSGEDRTVRIWDVHTGQQVGALQGVQEQVLALAVSPDGDLMATGGQGARVRLWSMQTGQQVGNLGVFGGPINALAFSPDGRLLVTGDGAGDLRWWDIASRQEIFASGDSASLRQRMAARRAHLGGVLTLAFSPNGKWLATGGGDGLVRVWRVTTRLPIAIMHGHNEAVMAVAYSPDGNTLVSGSRDGMVKFWTPNSENETPVQEALSRLTDQSSIHSLAFSPDGKMLVSGHDDGGMLFWRTTDAREPVTLTDKKTL
jgi:WD40 repeat protein